MVIKRLIPCLLYDGKKLVKTVNFKNPRYIGDPLNAIKIFNDKEVDELMLLDIRATAEKRRPDISKLSEFTSECFMPFSYGGGVNTFQDFKELFGIGIEKIVINSLLHTNPQLVKEVVRAFGSQAIVASIDMKKGFLGKSKPYSHCGVKIKFEIHELISYVQDELGVGEIILTSVDQEGTWSGFDFSLYEQMHATIKVPLIASGGAGSAADIRRVLHDLDCDAVAIGSMAVYQAKNMGILINFPKRENLVHQ